MVLALVQAIRVEVIQHPVCQLVYQVKLLEVGSFGFHGVPYQVLQVIGFAGELVQVLILRLTFQVGLHLLRVLLAGYRDQFNMVFVL